MKKNIYVPTYHFLNSNKFKLKLYFNALPNTPLSLSVHRNINSMYLLSSGTTYYNIIVFFS